MNQINRYLRSGFCGLLAPFHDRGQVEVGSYDELNEKNRLLIDMFDRFDCADLIKSEPPAAGTNVSNTSLGLSCIFIALKLQDGWTRRQWIPFRDILTGIDRALDVQPCPRFLSADLAAVIQDHWLENRSALKERYATSLPIVSDLVSGPEKLILGPDYAETIWNAAQPLLNEIQKSRLQQALEMVGDDLEAHLAALPEPMRPMGA